MDYKGANSPRTVARGKVYIIAAASLIVGLALGTFFSSYTTGFLAANGENGEEVNGFEEAKPQLEQQLRQQKEQEIIRTHLDELTEESDVEKNMEVIGEDDPDAVIATVNGEEIKKEDFNMLLEQEKQQLMMQGLDPESDEASAMLEGLEDEIVDNLIANAVLLQKIDEENVSVSEEEIEQQYQMYAEQFGGEDVLEEQIEMEGMTPEELKEEISEQLAVQNYLESYLDQHDIEISEDEIEEMYETHQEQIEQQMQMEQ